MLLSRFSRVRICVTPKTAAHQAPPSLGFSRQEHWSGLPCPPPGDLPNPGIELASSEYQAASLLLSHWGSPILSVYGELTLGVGDGQGGLACCSPWGRKESDTTE